MPTHATQAPPLSLMPRGSGRERIRSDEPHDLRHWALRLGVSTETLRSAIAAVGDCADDVKLELLRQRQRITA